MNLRNSKIKLKHALVGLDARITAKNVTLNGGVITQQETRSRGKVEQRGKSLAHRDIISEGRSGKCSIRRRKPGGRVEDWE